MIKFFRQTRLDLMENPTSAKASAGTKTGKYLKYAVGEIVLVVLGILIALSINNWNSNNIDLKYEQRILKGLKQNFTYNLQEVRIASKVMEVGYNTSAVLSDLIDPHNPVYTTEEVDSLLSIIINFGTFDASTGVIDEVINSGKLDIIQNEALKNHITNWTRIIIDTKKDEDILIDETFHVILPYLTDKVNLKNAAVPKELLKLTQLKAPSPSKFESDYDQVMKSLEFENMLNLHALNLMYVKYEYSNIQSYLENTIALIDTQLH